MTVQRWRFSTAAAALSVTLLLLVAYSALGAYAYLAPTLPTSEDLRGRNRQVPLRVYTRSGALIAQIGEQLRVPVTYAEIPPLVREAFLAAEDDNFFSHGGIDLRGILRALYVNATTGEATQGASTISQQLARTLFLSSEKRLKRKLQEVFLTFRLERDFSKEQILNTYLNVIFFGQRAYGVAAAAEVYYGKTLNELSVAEAATLAGLPKGPSIYNPVKNPEKALRRRTYVLQRMLALHYIDAEAAAVAQREPIRAREYAPLFEVEAPYVAEMARQEVIARFGEAAVNNGYRVYTTIDSRLQTAADRALRIGLLDYDRRHGYRGAARRSVAKPGATTEVLESALQAIPNAGLLKAAIVVSVAPKSARVYVAGSGFAQIEWSGLSWALSPGEHSAEALLTAGDAVYVISSGKTAELVQLPRAQGALVSIDPDDGAVVALVGGFDYNLSKFNRATQAERQPGSGFKPFLYSAALDHGFTPSSIIMDAPIMSDDRNTEQNWRPENSGGEFSGPMRLREALVKSRNLVSIRLLRGTGVDEVINYAARFGFSPDKLPRNETLALGSLSATPVTVANAYASLANGGYRVDWYFIDRIQNEDGEVVYRADPKRVCEICEQLEPPAAPAGPAAEAAPGVAPATALTPPASLLPPVTAAPPAPARLVARAGECMRPPDADQPGGPLVDAKHRAPRIVTAANAWLMDDILGDVVRRGTGRGAMVLGRNDLGGKTGTTNNERDTWFNGFNRHLVASVWVGFDEATPLGEGEQGSRTAVPIWVSYMREALRSTPDLPRPRPGGLISAHISPTTGLRLPDGDTGGIEETFLAEHLPDVGAAGETGTTDKETGNSLF